MIPPQPSFKAGVKGGVRVADGEQQKNQKTNQRPGELFFIIILFAIFGAFLIEAVKLTGLIQGASKGPGTIPQLVVFLVLILICIQGFFQIRNYSNKEKLDEILGYLFSKEVVLILLMVVLYAFLLEKLHFEITTLLFLFTAMYFIDRRKPLQKLLVSLGAIGFIVVVFAYLFKVVLP